MVNPNPEVLPGLLFEHSLKRPTDVALRWKRYGIWKEITWSQYADKVAQVAVALEKLGVKRGDVSTCICTNRPEWLYWELGSMLMGALPFAIFPDIEDIEMIAHYLEIARSRIILAEDQERVDRILALRERLPELEHIIVAEFKEVAHYHDPFLRNFDELLEFGREELRKNPDRINFLFKQLIPEEPCILLTTSGTTGLPKLAMLTSKSFVSMASHLNRIDPVKPGERYVSHLTTGWVGERMMSISWALVTGFTVYLPEDPETIWKNIREVAPTVIFAPPRTWEGIQTWIEIGINDTDVFKRKVYRVLLSSAFKIQTKLSDTGHISLKEKFILGLARYIVLNKITDYFGINNLRYAYTGGSAIGPEVILFFRTLGVNVKQIYGQSESSGIAVVHRDDDVKIETVGSPLPSIEIAITEDGEVLIRGDSVFKGYFKNQEKTRETLVDGWLHTGDYGYIGEENHLWIIDRITMMQKTHEGIVFSPQYLETKMKFSPYIREAVAIGQGRDFIGMLLQIDMDAVGNWAESRNIPYTTFRDLASNSEVYKLIEKEFNKINQLIPKNMRPRKFALLKKELDPELGDITYTSKLRRENVMARNKETLDELFGTGE
jgi:long-chain acyl-CoA synthetase